MRCSPAVPRSDLERMRTAPAAEQRAEGGAHAGADSERAAARKLHMAGVRPASRRHGKRCEAPRACTPRLASSLARGRAAGSWRAQCQP